MEPNLDTAPQPPQVDVPVAPSLDRWRSMTEEQRQAFLDEVSLALERNTELASEGKPHFESKRAALDALGGFFRRIGKVVYLGSEMDVIYPEERGFTPDLFAVLGVEDRGLLDERRQWAVATEGRGLDFVLEILHHGRRRKDLGRNVELYARLGIPEYFVFDRLRLRLHGYHLPAPSVGRYAPIPSRGGKLHSEVLGLDAALEGQRLRFYIGEAPLPEAEELAARLNSALDEAQSRAEQEAARAEQEAARAEQEAARADLAEERARAESARVAELERQVADLLARLKNAGTG